MRWGSDGRRALLAVGLGALLLVSGLAGCSQQPALDAAVTGVVYLEPGCPVQVQGSPCPPKPAEGATIDIRQDDTVVASTTTDTDGSFRIEAPSGQVQVVAHMDQGYRSQDIQLVQLSVGETVDVQLTLDSGIR